MEKVVEVMHPIKQKAEHGDHRNDPNDHSPETCTARSLVVPAKSGHSGKSRTIVMMAYL